MLDVGAPTVVGVVVLVVAGGRTRTGAVEATVGGTTVPGTVVDVVVVVDEVDVVEVDVVVAATEVVVGFVLVAAAAVDPLVVVDCAPRALASCNLRDPPGGPASTSAPAQSSAKPSSAAQPIPARHLRCCLRDLAIASSSTNGRRT